MTSECEDAEDMTDYIQTRRKERRVRRVGGGEKKTRGREARATDETGSSQGDPFIGIRCSTHTDRTGGVKRNLFGSPKSMTSC